MLGCVGSLVRSVGRSRSPRTLKGEPRFATHMQRASLSESPTKYYYYRIMSIRNGELISENGEPTKHFHFQSEASMGSPEELGVVTSYTSRLSLPITGRRLCEARSSLGRI